MCVCVCARARARVCVCVFKAVYLKICSVQPVAEKWQNIENSRFLAKILLISLCCKHGITPV